MSVGLTQPLLRSPAALLNLLLKSCSELKHLLLSHMSSVAEAAAATAVVQSPERTICRNISAGTWRRMYGSNPVRAQAWRDLRANPAETPADT